MSARWRRRSAAGLALPGAAAACLVAYRYGRLPCRANDRLLFCATVQLTTIVQKSSKLCQPGARPQPRSRACSRFTQRPFHRSFLRRAPGFEPKKSLVYDSGKILR